MEFLFFILVVAGMGTGSAWVVIKNLYYICQPNEVIIFAGSQRQISDDKTVGYRLVKGGSSLRLPLLEKSYRLDLTNMIIELKVVNAFSKDGIPLKVDGIANIKIAGEEPIIHNAIQRLLGKSRKDIEQLAKETLEGNLRGVLASLTPEQVNEDKIAFAKSLLEEAEEDLEKLGLILDNLQIQNISDDVQYLNSIGRKQQAEMLRDARIAEANTRAESIIKESENERITSLRKIERDLAIAQAEAERRIRDTLSKRQAMMAEVEGTIAAQIARTEAEKGVQNAKIKQVEMQLQADIVAPAEAECKQAIAKARGDAATIIQQGKARVEGSKRLAESWRAAGSNAKEIFLLQKLEALMELIASSIPEVEIQNLTVIDNQKGSSNTAKIAAFMEELRQATGVDLVEMLNKLGRSK